MLYTYRTIYRLLSVPQRWEFRWLVLAMLFASLLNMTGVALILPFLALVAEPTVATDNAMLSRLGDFIGAEDRFDLLTVLGLAVFVLVMCSIVSQAATFYWANRFARQLALSLGVERLSVYLSQPYEWFLQHHSAELGKSVLIEIKEVITTSLQPSLRVLANGFVVLTLAGLLVLVDPVGALLIGLGLAIAFGVIYLGFSRKLNEMGADRRVANRERHQVAGEVLSGIKEVKMLGLETAYIERFFNPSRRLAIYEARVSLISEMPRWGIEALTFGGMLLFTLYLLQTRDGSLEHVLPVLGAFAFAGIRLMPTAQTLFRDISQIRFGRPALMALAEDLDTEGRSRARQADRERRSEGSPLRVTDRVRLNHVSYRYPGAENDAIRDVSLEIPLGASVGFVGPTGSGKTTVTDLILGLIRPRQGALEVDGQVIDGATVRLWQRNIGFVPQTIHLIDDSIARNISRSLPGETVDMAAVERAARLASLHDFVASLPEGYQTTVGDAGVKLSGGQRQRVGIARALYRDPEVIVFDEATSALDTVTERAVMEATKTLHGRKTLILVSHRLSTLAHCDRIFVMDRGQLVAAGDFATLQAESGTFRAMLAAAAE